MGMIYEITEMINLSKKAYEARLAKSGLSEEQLLTIYAVATTQQCCKIDNDIIQNRMIDSLKMNAMVKILDNYGTKMDTDELMLLLKIKLRYDCFTYKARGQAKYVYVNIAENECFDIEDNYQCNMRNELFSGMYILNEGDKAGDCGYISVIHDTLDNFTLKESLSLNDIKEYYFSAYNELLKSVKEKYITFEDKEFPKSWNLSSEQVNGINACSNYQTVKALRLQKNILKNLESRLEGILNKEPDDDFGILSDDEYKSLEKNIRKEISAAKELISYTEQRINTFDKPDIVEFTMELKDAVLNALDNGIYYDGFFYKGDCDNGGVIDCIMNELKQDEYFAGLYVK